MLVAGWPGLGASVAAIVLVTVLRRRRVAAAGVGAAAVGAAVMFAVAKPWAGLDSWSGSLATPQLLALAGVSAMAAVGLRRPSILEAHERQLDHAVEHLGDGQAHDEHGTEDEPHVL